MAKKITQAFILGAGLGTRLRPLTNTMPKVMVPIAPGKPLLEHTIEHLRDQGITDFVVNVHYLPEVITTYFGNGKKLGVRIEYSDETKQLLETGGALRNAEALLDDQFLFLYGDEMHFFDFKPVIHDFFEHDAMAVIVLKKSEHPHDGEIADFDPITHRITQWYTRPHEISELHETRLVNSGLYAFSKKILNYIPAEGPIKLDGAVIPAACKAGEKFQAFPTEETILDVGRPEKYESAKKYYQSHSVYFS